MSDYDNETLEQAHNFENVTRSYSVCKKCFFSIMSDLFNQPSDGKPQSRLEKCGFYGLQILIGFNLAGILWSHNANIGNWQDFRILWLVFEFSRIDMICSEIYQPEVCIFGTYAFYFLISSILILIFVSRVLFKASLRPVVYILSKLIILSSVVNFMLFLLLALTLKYSWTHAIPTEYERINTTLDQSTLGVVLSICGMIIVVGLGCWTTVFDYDCRHSHASSSLKAKAYSKIELNSLFCNYFSILLYTFVGPLNFVTYLVAMMIMHTAMALMYCYYLPYYSFDANYIKSSCNVFAVVSSFLMIIAHLIDNAMIGIYGLCTVLPLTLVIWRSGMLYREANIKLILIEIIKDTWEFELIMRKELLNCKEDKVNETLDRFYGFYSQNSCLKYKHVILWEVCYLYYSCKYERVAFFQLSRKADIEDSLEEQYQEYIIRKAISDKIYERYEEYRFTTKIYKFEKAKRLDKEACLLAFKYWASIVSTKSTLKSLEDDGRVLKSCLDSLNTKYSSLIQQFPDSIILLDLYSSFVISFYNDTEKFQMLTVRKDNILKYESARESKSLSIFTEENPLFLISANNKNIGQITYSNSHLADLLQISVQNLINQPITAIFPLEFTCFRPENLKLFKTRLRGTTTYLEENIALLTPKGFLVEAAVIMSLFGSINPLFLCICKPIDNKRGVVMIEKDGTILHYNEMFMHLIGLDYDLRGWNIDVVANIDFKSLKHRKNLRVRMNHCRSLAAYFKFKMADTVIRYLHFYESEASYKEHSVNNGYLAQAKVTNKVSFQIDDETMHVHCENEIFSTRNEMHSTGDQQMPLVSKSEGHSSNMTLKRMTLCAQQSIKALRYFKIILFISVTITQILIVVVSCLAILTYIVISIDSSVSQTSIDTLGSALYLFANLGDFSSVIQLCIPGFPNLIPIFLAQFSQSLNALQAIQSNFTQYNSQWDHCGVSEKLFQDIIPVHEIANSTRVLRFRNMIDFMGVMLDAVIYI